MEAPELAVRGRGAGRRGSNLVHLRDSRGFGVRGRRRWEVKMAESPNFCLKLIKKFGLL